MAIVVREVIVAEGETQGFFPFGGGYTTSFFLPDTEAPLLQIRNVSGGRIGEVVSKGPGCILNSLTCSLNKNGNGDFRLSLSKFPDFIIGPGSILTFDVFGERVYTGIIDIGPLEDSGQKEYVYTGYGYYHLLKDTIGEGTFPAGVDVGQIVRTILTTIVAPETGISSNTDLVTTETGVQCVEEQILQGANIKELLDIYAGMGICRWGIENVSFYLEKISDDPVKLVSLPFKASGFEPTLNVQEIRNQIRVLRKFDSNESGWTIGAIANDLDSQAVFNRVNVEEIEVNALMSDADCDIIAQAKLDELAWPKYSAKLKNFPLRSREDLPRRGIWRFIDHKKTRPIVIDSFSTADWIPSNTGIEIETTTDRTEGVSALKVEWTTPGTIQKSFSANNVKKFTGWFRSEARGVIANIHFIDASHVASSFSIRLPQEDIYFQLEFNLDIEELVSIEIDLLASSGVLLFDTFKLRVAGAVHYDLDFTSANLTFSPGKIMSDMEFGPPQEKITGQVNSILSSVKNNKAMNKRSETT